MKKLLSIELTRYFKSIITLITFGLILAMYITQCLPEKWYWYAKPMNEIQFMYTKMVEDYSNGYTEELKINNVILCAETQFNDVAREELLKSIKQINPEYTKNDAISDTISNLNKEKFRAIMDNLNQKLGGKSYYGDSVRPMLYSQYTTNAFHINRSLDILDKIAAMEQYLKYTIQEKSFSNYTNLVQRQQNLDDKDLAYLTDIYSQMTNLKKESVTYDLYDAWYNGIDKRLGGNTAFGIKNRQFVFNLINNLEGELKYFESIKNEEKVTNAYARYYSDYMVVLAGILPAIFGAFTLIEDRRYKMHELVYANPVKSSEQVISKYLSIIILFSIFFYLIAAISTVLFYRFGHMYNLGVDNLAFFKYTTFWVMPTVLFTTALSMLLSVLLNSGVIVIVIQLVVFFMSAQPLIGGYSWYRSIIRYNIVGDINFYRINIYPIMINRIVISIISILLLSITIRIYSIVRKKGSLVEMLVSRLYLYKGRSL